MRRSIALVAVLAVVSILITPAFALAARGEKDASFNASGTRTSTTYCSPAGNGVSVEFEGQSVGQHTGAGTLVYKAGLGLNDEGARLGPGPWTFTDASGLHTLTGTAQIAFDFNTSTAGIVLTVSSGTGKFADVTGGQLATERVPVGGACEPGVISERFNPTLTGTLTYS